MRIADTAAAVRSRAYRLCTRLPDPVRARTAPALKLLGAGPLKVSGGIGVGLRLDTRALPVTHVQAYGLVRGSIEPGVQEALRRHVAPGSIVYDVGANLGFFSLLAARLGARVEAFEPLPAAAAALRRNVALNGFDGVVRVHEAAVGAAEGRANFLSVAEGSWSHLADRGRHARTVRTLEVEVVALDGLRLPAPDVVKIDVEGSEGAVLAGMARRLRDARPVIVCETHATNAEVADALEAAGYAIQNLDGPQPVRHAGPIHVLAVPCGS